jgi:1-phosphofructokinase
VIVTLTANPAVDRTVRVDRLVRGEVHRGGGSWTEPSGKGVNVTLALHAHGKASIAVLPLGGQVGDELKRMLDGTGAPIVTVPIAETIRTNVSLLEPDGTVTKVNEPGPRLSEPEARSLSDAALTAARDATWLACCGSLPAGLPARFYADLVRQRRADGLPTAVDSSGASLAAALDAEPALIKPNLDELAELTGRKLRTLGDVAEAGKAVLGHGVGSVLASLGAHGALLIEQGGVLFGEAPVARPVSAVGAGDALLAGFLAGGGKGGAALETALRWAATAVLHPGTTLSSVDERIAVSVTAEPDLARPLH